MDAVWCYSMTNDKGASGRGVEKNDVHFSTFVRFLRKQDGQQFKTLAKKKSFRLSIDDTHVCYTPNGTGKTRRTKLANLAWMFERHRTIGSYRTADYTASARNRSYVLSLIKRFYDGQAALAPVLTG